MPSTAFVGWPNPSFPGSFSSSAAPTEAASGYGFHRLSTMARMLEDAIAAHVSGAATANLPRALDKLVTRASTGRVRIDRRAEPR